MCTLSSFGIAKGVRKGRNLRVNVNNSKYWCISGTLFIQNSSTHLRSLNKVFAQFDLFKEFLIMGIFAYSKIKKSLSIKKKK